ncbi:cadA [Enterococcus sp. 10A9_DIV0425]|uniref:Cytokinin riboside 5'-monophosphate phosphoribohydrolase n=1 Tax=Candidatus Enterococcus wittei TaxID=1987383 RepID=A0A242JXV9_9ENTE|nr:TIGR00730 family Rossman fold protein [Enterococcus sp. 10A9_DIV0425]OTP10157.1 cadA [Enterococcus sp. 10A9_DIV0425]THE12383.1 TIGR00730 family Rossman fold protein [Enterococcus hirae]
MKLTVFCGSRFGNKESYKFIAQMLGKYMAQEEIELVYGGSDSGIMGIFSQTVLENNGKVTGIYPVGLFREECPKTDLTTFISTETIDERKTLLFEKGDAALVFPGGLGTLEEFSQLLSWMAIGLIPDKPIGILDIGGYYSGLRTLIGTFTKEGFMDSKWLDQLFFSNNPLVLVNTLRSQVDKEMLLCKEAE